MPFLLLIFLMIACMPFDWPLPPFGWGVHGSLIAVGAMVALLVGTLGVLSMRIAHQLDREPDRRYQLGRQYQRIRSTFFFVNIAALALALGGFGWGWASRELATIDTDAGPLLLPGAELLTIAPLFLAMIGSWFAFHAADRRFHRLNALDGSTRRFWTRREYVSYLLRQNLILVFAPLSLMIGQQGLFRLFPEWLEIVWVRMGLLAAFPAFLFLLPLVLPRLLAWKPLPEGTTRERFTALAERLDFRHAGLYLADTRSGVANAMVVGLVGRARLVCFTDRLLEELTPEEADSVFGHEIGHAKHGHIGFYALFLLLSFMLLGAVHESVRDTSLVRGIGRDGLLLAPIVMMAVYMFGVFGFLSRRCERQADVYGCKAVSCDQPHCFGHDAHTVYPVPPSLCRTGIETFVQALERVAAINGMHRPRLRWRGVGLRGKLAYLSNRFMTALATWQHDTISERVAYLRTLEIDPSRERQFQRGMGRLKWGLVAGLVAASGLVVWYKGWEVLVAAV